MSEIATSGQDEQLAIVDGRRTPASNVVLEIRLELLANIDNVASRLSDQSHWTTFVIPIDQWLQAMNAAGAGRRRLVELPLPLRRDDPLWDAALDALDRATNRLQMHDYGAAMSESRTATERLTEAIGATLGFGRGSDPFGPYLSKVKDGVLLRQKTKDDPFRVLASSLDLARELFGFASSIHKGLDFNDLRDAELAIAVVAAIYTFAARAFS